MKNEICIVTENTDAMSRKTLQNFLLRISRVVEVDGDQTEHLCNNSDPPHNSQFQEHKLFKQSYYKSMLII